MRRKLSRAKAVVGAISGLGLLLGTAMPSFAYAGAQGDGQNDAPTELADTPDAVGTDAALDVEPAVEPVVEHPAATVEYVINYYDYRTHELIKSRTVEDAPLADDRYDTIEAWARKHGVMDYSDAPYGHDLKAMDDSKLYSEHVYSVYYERCGYKNVPATVDYWTIDEAGTGRVKIADRVEFTIPQPVLDDNRADDAEQYADCVLPYILDIPNYKFSHSDCYPGVYIVRSSGRQFEAGLGDTSYDVYYVENTQRITFSYIDEESGTEIAPSETHDDITTADGFRDGMLVGGLPDKFVKSFDGYAYTRHEACGDKHAGAVKIYYKKIMAPWTVRGIAADEGQADEFAPNAYVFETEPSWVLDTRAPETTPRDIDGWWLARISVDPDSREIVYSYKKTPEPPAPPKEEEDITPPANEEKTPEPAPKQEQAKEEEPVPAPEPRQEEKEAPEPTVMPQTGDTAPITAALLAAGLAAVAGGVATRRLIR